MWISSRHTLNHTSKQTIAFSLCCRNSTSYKYLLIKRCAFDITRNKESRLIFLLHYWSKVVVRVVWFEWKFKWLYIFSWKSWVSNSMYVRSVIIDLLLSTHGDFSVLSRHANAPKGVKRPLNGNGMLRKYHSWRNFCHFWNVLLMSLLFLEGIRCVSFFSLKIWTLQ